MSEQLFIRPADDSSAIQVAAWGQALLHKASGYGCADLAGDAVSREQVDGRLSSEVDNLFFFGHGNQSALLAHSQPVIDLNNIHAVPGIVVAIACFSAVLLGVAAVEGFGVRAYLGFDDELGFPGKAPLPMGLAVTNALASMFTLNRSVGWTATELRVRFTDAQREYKANGAAYGLSLSEARTAWLFAKSNRYSLQLFGDENATIA